MAEKLRKKFLLLSKNEQIIVKAIVLVVAVMLVSVPFAYAGNLSNSGFGYKDDTYTYGYSGYSDNIPAAVSSLACTAIGNCTWTAPTTTRGGSLISAGPFGGGSIASYKIHFSTSTLSACSGGTSLTSTSVSKTLENLAASTTYNVAVCAVDNNGNTGVVATASLTTDAAASTGSSGGGGGSTSTPPASTPAAPSTAPSVADIKQILSEAQVLSNVEGLLHSIGVTSRNNASEKSYEARIKTVLGKIDDAATVAMLVNFVTYGTSSTVSLGAGERLGVLNSYRSAYGRVPATEAQWSDAIKIANGRWPSEISTKAEARAKATFKTIYKHDANMANANENAAVTVMAYGLRPGNRNLNSEKVAIKNFRGTFGRAPSLATDWDMVRAIAYSGAKR